MKKYCIEIRYRSIFSSEKKSTGYKTLDELKSLFKDVLTDGRLKGSIEVKPLDEIKTIKSLIENLERADINLSKGFHNFYVVIGTK